MNKIDKITSGPRVNQTGTKDQQNRERDSGTGRIPTFELKRKHQHYSSPLNHSTSNPGRRGSCGNINMYSSPLNHSTTNPDRRGSCESTEVGISDNSPMSVSSLMESETREPRAAYARRHRHHQQSTWQPHSQTSYDPR